VNIFEAIIQGIVQGITEFLPVSSSGHLSITQHIFGQSGEGNLFFNVMLHLGTLVAVCFYYRKLILSLIKDFGKLIADIFKGNFKWSQMSPGRNLIVMLIIGLLPLFLLFMPIIGTDMQIKDLADMLAGGSKTFIVVGLSLLVTSVLLLVGGLANKHTEQKYKAAGKLTKSGGGRKRFNLLDAVSVGLMQMVAAVLPGLSRSGSTLAVGQLRGINRQSALDYTCVLSIPSILAAAVLELKDAFDVPAAPGGPELPGIPMILAGMIAAAVVGYFSIVLFKWLLKTDRMYIFIVYTALVGIAVTIISIVELNSGYNIFSGTPLV
jgi:undecaprenyl-diphosphatase